MQSLDVVTVPDFSGKRAAVFEARTLFFLASWIEFSEKLRRFPLHLACIGDPPESVLKLSERAEARVSVHDPIAVGSDASTANKLRAFDVVGKTGRILVLDTDVFVRGDLSALASMPDCFAAAPGTGKISKSQWNEIYDIFELPRPLERIRGLYAELGIRLSRPWLIRCIQRQIPRLQNSFRQDVWTAIDDSEMYPYYNSGVILAPSNTDLPQLWRDGIVRIADYFRTQSGLENSAMFCRSDQAGLAVALERLERRGYARASLSEDCHCRPEHLYGGRLGIDSMLIFHAMGFLSELPARDMTEGPIRHAIDRYFSHHLRRLFLHLLLNDLLQFRGASCIRRMLRAQRLARQLHAYVNRLFEDYVIPVLHEGSKSSVGEDEAAAA